MSICLNQVLEKLLHLLLDKLLNFLGHHFDLLGHMTRSTVDIFSGLLDDDLDLLNVWNFKIVLCRGNLNSLNGEDLDSLLRFGSITTLANDIGIVARATTVPCKVLENVSLKNSA